jgi:tRNA(adenine34) deaminase
MDNEYYIKRCISLAKKSRLQNEIPVGAVLVYKDEVISEGHNLSISKNDPTAHAEINVLRDACKKRNNYRLNNSVLYVSLEPCIMCIGAICEARINKVIFGAFNTNEVNFYKKFNYVKKEYKLDHTPKFIGGILKEECSSIIKDFFKTKRG